MKMSEYLARRSVEVGLPRRTSGLQVLSRTLEGTKISVFVSGVVAVLAAADCLTKDSYLDASLGIRCISGIVSGVTAQVLFVYRRHKMAAVLSRMAAVAHDLEALLDPDTQMKLERTPKWCRRVQQAWAAYSFVVPIAVLLPTLTTGGLSIPMWPLPASLPAPQLAIPVTYAAQVVAAMCCPIAFYRLVGQMLEGQLACAALYRATGAVARSAGGAGELADCVRLHGTLNKVADSLDSLTSDSMVMLMIAVFQAPIQGIYDVVKGHVDGYLLTAFPTILFVFVPLCFTAQELSESSELVGFRAYEAEWPWEEPPVRKMRSVLMVRASRPAQITCNGLGSLGHPACENILKTWFSYLNTLLQLK